MAADRRYWDANVFLGWLKAEADKVAACQGVLDAAEAGTIEIVTSALTLTEVIKMKGQQAITRDKEEKIRGFFEQPYIIIREVDRYVAEAARELIWSHGVDPKDAIHLATAIRLHLPYLDTFDDKLIGLTGKLGIPKITIGHPNVPHTPDMFPDTKQQITPKRRIRVRRSQGKN
jgi:predicted nucleic acid-binding protein